ncbi:hypothetical protein PYS58_16335 [Chryseobacterium indologenes]|uniref:hypothetical protein n=1 Tax=Chryseobacterium indologenes TaxID=253 RepID=UPI0023E7886C|nr:hypothetical protein [Chryseobacterium indologenes]WET48134.1 hypothetical protein PYS58_16335 [Chryseobacterium indologenes]
MKNKNLKNVLEKFNQLENSKAENMEILNPDQQSSIKGGLADIECPSRFKIKCQKSFSIKEIEENM